MHIVNAIGFLETAQSPWDEMSRVKFMEVNGLTGVGQSEWENQLYKLS